MKPTTVRKGLATGFPRVAGYCPACHAASLFLGAGSYITCARFDCPDPTAASDILERRGS